MSDPEVSEALSRWRGECLSAERQRDELAEALRNYMHAMEGFAQAVREVTGAPFPWPTQDIALEAARAALAKAGGHE